MASSRTNLELPGPVVLVICEILTTLSPGVPTLEYVFFRAWSLPCLYAISTVLSIAGQTVQTSGRENVHSCFGTLGPVFRRRQPGTLTWPEHGPSGRQLAAKTAKTANQTPKAQRKMTKRTSIASVLAKDSPSSLSRAVFSPSFSLSCARLRLSFRPSPADQHKKSLEYRVSTTHNPYSPSSSSSSNPSPPPTPSNLKVPPHRNVVHGEPIGFVITPSR